LLLAGALLAAFVALEPRAEAQSELPVGKFGFVTGVRQNVGELGDTYQLGGLLGISAGYQPSSLGRVFSLGVSWSVLWSWIGTDDPSQVTTTLRELEMNFGLRIRRVLGSTTPRFIAASTGVTLLRTSIPVPPDDDRLYVGPYLGIGLEQYFLGKFLMSFDARYGLIAGGPNSLTLMLSISFGSR
jgi:hypothetical protein